MDSGHATWVCRAFLASVGPRVGDLDPRAVAPATRAVARIGRVIVTLSEPAHAVHRRLREAKPFTPGPELDPGTPNFEPGAGALDVERVLRDL